MDLSTELGGPKTTLRMAAATSKYLSCDCFGILDSSLSESLAGHCLSKLFAANKEDFTSFAIIPSTFA